MTIKSRDRVAHAADSGKRQYGINNDLVERDTCLSKMLKYMFAGVDGSGTSFAIRYAHATQRASRFRLQTIAREPKVERAQIRILLPHDEHNVAQGQTPPQTL